jgi:uncharacterized protein YcfL
VSKIGPAKFALLLLAIIFAPISKLNQSTMKKLFAVVVIAGALVACNNSSESTPASDSSATVSDSGKSVMSTDTIKMSTDTSKMSTDTSKMSADTTHKK